MFLNSQIQRADWQLAEVEVGVWGGEMDERGQKIQTFGFKISKPGGCNVHYGAYN